ncbi:MAG: UDP-glucose 4-epimerase GalE [Parachlamydiales bacterium]|nr:UDP-glucose 4-epimerase GalE [Parachlamydiales bacterium]
MAILVVGGAGYIGSHVCKALKEAGFTPVVYDNLSTGHSWAIQFGPSVIADLEDEAALLNAFYQYQPDAVIHLASLINVRDSIVNPALYWEKNLVVTLALLKAMMKANVLNLVFSSTAAIYGSPQRVPIDESHPKAPMNAYGKTKWAVEEMLQDFSNAHGLQFAALRYFNASGADPSAIIGEAHEPETHLIPLVIRTALGVRERLMVYGQDFATPDGTAIRDYIHVSDLANAHILALKYLFKQKKSLQVNLGTGTGYSVKEIVQAVESFGGKRVPVEIVSRLAHDSPMLVADPSKAKEILNWHPQMSDLPSIISTAWNWEINKPSVVLNKLLSNTIVSK